MERRPDERMGKKHRPRLRWRRRILTNKRSWQRYLRQRPATPGDDR